MNRFFGTPEMLSNLATRVSFADIAAFGAVCKEWRSAMQTEVEIRIRESMQSNLDALGLSFEDFMQALDECEGGLVGSGVLGVMYHGTPWEEAYRTTPRLTVVVPKGARNTFIGLLNQSNWQWMEKAIGKQGRDVIESICEVERLRPGKEAVTGAEGDSAVCEGESQPVDQLFLRWSDEDEEETARRRRRQRIRHSKVFLRVVESKGHVLQVISSSSSTRDMVVLTSTRLYLLYPKLQHANLGLRSRHTFEIGDNRVSVPAIDADNTEWGFPCGKLCPIISRKGREGDGTGVFWWNRVAEAAILEEGDAEKKRKREDPHSGWGNNSSGWGTWGRPEPDAYVMRLFKIGCLFNRDEFKATLGRQCENVACPNYGKKAVVFQSVEHWFVENQ